MTKTLGREDVVDILKGASILGGGGGGDLQEGLDLIDRAAAAGKSFRMVSLAEVPDDALICTPYLLGAVSDLPQGTDALIDGTTPPILRAFERLNTLLDRPIFGAVPCEMGGSNTAVPFYLAAMAGAVVVDADPTGRAVPEITHSAYALAGLPVGQIVAANARGETMILENVSDDLRAEQLVRSLAQQSHNDIAVIDHALPARMLRPALLPGTLSQAQRLGGMLRHMQDTPRALPQRIAEAAQGRVMFRGEVSASTADNKDGFTIGTFDIAGTGDFQGSQFRVDLKNENMVGWHDGTPVVTIPEIISILDTRTGQVVTNPHVSPGQEVAVLVLPAPDIFLTEEGLASFGPSYAGVDMAFKSALGQG
jgi:DUF917 family protein